MVDFDSERQTGRVTTNHLIRFFSHVYGYVCSTKQTRRQFERLCQGTMTITEYDVKFTELATYTHFLVADEHEKVRQFVDGLEHCYRGHVVRDVRGDTY